MRSCEGPVPGWRALAQAAARELRASPRKKNLREISKLVRGIIKFRSAAPSLDRPDPPQSRYPHGQPSGATYIGAAVAGAMDYL